MKFKIEVSSASGTWFETYDEHAVTTEAQAVDFGNRTIAYFNSTLRPHEEPRTFTGKAELVGAGKGGDHDWRKKNLVTLSDHRGWYDNMECDACGITARRYGLSTIKRSVAFRAKKYAYCSGAPIST